jgi:Zn finger protein HypA/HybF involved in hydrogenase expression
MIHLKPCSKCGKIFDIDTSKDLCPKCRNKKEGIKDGRENSNRDQANIRIQPILE